MIIDAEMCNRCKACLVFCPMEAIKASDNLVYIDQDLCVECGVCKRVADCKKDAINEPPISWPRSIRKIFSDPLTSVPETRVTGRGTEEMKTNEITNRIDLDEIGFAIDLGRPALGTKLGELETITKELSKLNVTFEKDNPVTMLMTDPLNGIFRDDIKEERVLSAIIEFKVNKQLMLMVMHTLKKVAAQINTVFSVGIISRVEADGTIPAIESLKDSKYFISSKGKVNIGIGKSSASHR